MSYSETERMCDIILAFACFSTPLTSWDNYGLLFEESKCNVAVYIKHIQIRYVLSWSMS
jgi:hypothetical protein